MNIFCAEALGLGTVRPGIAPEPYRMGRVREILNPPARRSGALLHHADRLCER